MSTMSYKEAFEKPDRAEWLRQDVWPPDVFLIYPKADEATKAWGAWKDSTSSSGRRLFAFSASSIGEALRICYKT